MTYNGWKNWETWNVICWDIFYMGNGLTTDEARAQLEDYLETIGVDFSEANLLVDVAGRFLSAVDYEAIVAYYEEG